MLLPRVHPDDQKFVRPSEGKPISKLAIRRSTADAKANVAADFLAISLAGKAALEISNFRSEGDLAWLWDSEDELRKIQATLSNTKKKDLQIAKVRRGAPGSAKDFERHSLTLTAQAEVEASIAKLVLRRRDRDSRVTNHPGSSSASVSRGSFQLEHFTRILGTGSSCTVAMQVRKPQVRRASSRI